MLLPVHLFPAAGYLTARFGSGGSLASVSLLPCYRLMYQRLVEGHSEHGIAYFDILYYLTVEVMYWVLHSSLPLLS